MEKSDEFESIIVRFKEYDGKQSSTMELGC